MNLEDIASHFSKVRMTARGFTAACPAHNDTNPSLSVDEGRTWFVVSCGTGCTFDEVVAAAGLHPRDFKIGDHGEYDSRWASDMKARDRMQQMREVKGTVLSTFGEIVEVALSPDPERLADVTDRWSMMGLQFEEAMKMYHVSLDGPVFDLLHGGHDRYVKDWREEKIKIGRELWVVYRKHGPR